MYSYLQRSIVPFQNDNGKIIKQNSIRQNQSHDAPIEINFRPISMRVIEILSRAPPSFVVQKEAKIYKVDKTLTQNSKK